MKSRNFNTRLYRLLLFGIFASFVILSYVKIAEIPMEERNFEFSVQLPLMFRWISEMTVDGTNRFHSFVLPKLLEAATGTRQFLTGLTDTQIFKAIYVE